MQYLNPTMLSIVLSATLLGLVACSETTPIDEARDAYFATLDGDDQDCEGWLQWCIDEGYPQEACEERNEYCENGRWVGGERGDDDDSADPCGAAAEAAYDDCIADGGSEEQCREAAADAYDDCDRG
ncbi:MAG: hypothetical protein CL928_08680 [Deltaproteobacteria bacterium]|nr:hypothetical protein [Deltaproteobacteria bacterium]